MKKKLIKFGLLVTAIACLYYGFGDGVEWAKVIAIAIGGFCLAILLIFFNES